MDTVVYGGVRLLYSDPFYLFIAVETSERNTYLAFSCQLSIVGAFHKPAINNKATDKLAINAFNFRP